jgi:hypothetical protein
VTTGLPVSASTYQVAHAPRLSALKAAADQLRLSIAASLVEVINPRIHHQTAIEGALVVILSLDLR